MPEFKTSLKNFFRYYDSQRSDKQPPSQLFFLIWLLALVIALIGLGDVPLRDFDEGTVARVSWELSYSKGIDHLLPTIWESNYLNKPPGIHWLIALSIQVNRFFSSSLEELPSSFVIRIVPAILSTLVVPLGGWIQWYLRPKDYLASVLTSGILLTLLPLARHGKLAMLDGMQLSAIALFWLCLVACNGKRNDRLRALGAGLSSSCMLLLKAPLLVPVGCVAFISIVWSGEIKNFKRKNIIFWGFLGLFPGILWHIWHALQRGSQAMWLWWGDGAGRVLFDAGSGSDLGWRVPVIEIVEGGWPWLLLWPIGIVLTFRDRNSRWGKWTLCMQTILLIAIIPLKTQLPWYSHPIWLPFALICAVPLAWLIDKDPGRKLPCRKYVSFIPIFWIAIALLLITFALLGMLGLRVDFQPYSLIALTAGLGWVIGSFLLRNLKQSKREIGSLFIISGSFFALIFLMSSNFWLWELNEHWPVLPVVKLSDQVLSSNIAIDTEFERPSLNWYAKKRIPILKNNVHAQWIITRSPSKFILRDKKQNCKSIREEKEWHLISCNN